MLTDIAKMNVKSKNKQNKYCILIRPTLVLNN